MSAPHDNHSDKKYPEDGVTNFPRKKKSEGPLHKVANRLNAKNRALKKAMGEVGGRFTFKK